MSRGGDRALPSSFPPEGAPTAPTPEAPAGEQGPVGWLDRGWGSMGAGARERTIHRPRRATSRRAIVAAVHHVLLAVVCFLVARWGVDIDWATARALLVAGAVMSLVTPALIRLSAPIVAWLVPLLGAAPTAIIAAWAARRASVPDPDECGMIGAMTGTCSWTHWGWWALVGACVLLALKMAHLAWNSYEDSITPITVDGRW